MRGAVLGLPWSGRPSARAWCVALAVAFGLLLLNAPVALAVAGDFTAAATSPEAAGDSPQSVAVGDFNVDGKPDVATANNAVDNVTIMLGDGTGNFTELAATSPEPTGDGPVSVAVGDFNGDGKPDLATANQFADNVTILIGDGSGNFTAAGPEAAGDAPYSVAVGDFNGDGKQDLATANIASDDVTVLIGDGSGNFTAAAGTSPEAAGDAPQSVAVGDFNGDGKQDLATANGGSDDVTVLIGDGSGNFTAAAGTSPEAAGDAPQSVAVGDFNSDGKQDLAIATFIDDKVTILLGDGTGNFTPAATSPENAGDGPLSLAVGDFNSDGKQDLAAANRTTDDVTVLIGDGTGNFTAAATSPEAVGDAPLSVAVGDFNGDGKPDLATANVNSDNVTILINQTPARTNANFSPAGTSPEGVGDGAFSVAVGDFNGDGKPDLASANSNANNVTVLLGDGSGNFAAAGTSPETAGTAPRSVAVGDFNGDGKPDLAAANYFSNNVTVLLGDGTGNFTAAGTSPEIAGTNPRSVAVGDFNGDGKQDLATANEDSNNVTILIGDGTGNFTPAATGPEPTGGASPRSVAVGDFNGDGKPDLATANFDSATVTVLLGDGTGNFTAAGTSPEPAGATPVSVAVGDFNGDGKQDLAATSLFFDNVTVLIGDGTGNFAPAATSPEPAGRAPQSVVVGDFNGDGKQDLATANGGSDNVTVLIGDGTGNFAPAATSPEPGGDAPQSVVVGDFNGDGRQDLATANLNSDNVTILLADDPTVAVDDAETVAEDAAATTIDVRANDSDNDSGNEKIASVATTADTHGTVAITNGGDDLTYEPAADYCNAGPPNDAEPDATFTYTLANGGTATVSVTVNCADDPTVAADDAKTVGEDAAATTIDVRANDTDIDSAKDKIASVNAGAAAHGSVAITNGGDDLTYTPAANYCGAASFTYTLTGGGTATVSVTVTCAEDAGVAVNDSQTVGEDAAATTFDVRANDTDNDGAKDKIASVNAGAPARGSVAITNSGDDLTYTPESNYCGDASFSYTLTGGGTATVSVTVTCVDDAPVAVGDAATFDQDSGTSPIDVLANDTDIDAGPRQVASVTQPTNGTAAVAADGTRVTYAPAAGYCNSQPGGTPDSFSYKLNGGSETTVAVTVRCAPPAAPGEPVPPRLGASHRRVVLDRGRVVVRLICRSAAGQRCIGTLTLKATSRETRLTAAAAGRARFSIAAGRSATIRVQPTKALRARLDKRGKAIAELTARMSGDGAARRPLKRLITVHAGR